MNNNNLPTLNQYIGPGNQFPKTVPPGYSTVPDKKSNQKQPQQPNWNQPQGNWNQGQHHYEHWNKGPQQGH
jgi:hypothetical protein